MQVYFYKKAAKKQYIDLSLIKRLIEFTCSFVGKSKSSFNIILCGERFIRKINKKFKSNDNVTDVIAFDLEDEGEIYICWGQVKRWAKRLGKSNIWVLSDLIVHGILHILGFEHKEYYNETEEFFKLQQKIVENFLTRV